MPLPVVTSDAFSTAATTTKAVTTKQDTSVSPTGTEEFTSLDSPQTESEGSTMPSLTPSSTLATTTRTSELLTATASDGVPTYDWGPAITASALSTAATGAANADPQLVGGGMSNGGRTTLIATTTIGTYAETHRLQCNADTIRRWHLHPGIPHICALAETKGSNLFRDYPLPGPLQQHYAQSRTSKRLHRVAYLPRVAILCSSLQAQLHAQL